jgi:hypothetical protein
MISRQARTTIFNHRSTAVRPTRPGSCARPMAFRIAQEAGITLVARGVLGFVIFAAPGVGR